MSAQTETKHTGATCEFSLAHYRELLREVAHRMAPRTFAAHLANGHMDQPYLLMRHDVDVSFNAATAICDIEFELGIRSTYFVRTCSRGYSLQDPAVRGWLRGAVERGFEIGLHEDSTRLESDRHAVVRKLREDRELIEAITGAPVKGVSTHMPKRSIVPLTLDMVEAAGFHYEAGAPAFNLPGTTFFSDANGAWNSSCPCKKAATSSRFYLLTHPEWWIIPPSEVSDMVKRIIEGY